MDRDLYVQELVDRGLFTENSDGTYKPTDEGYRVMQEFFEEHPEMYPKIFPKMVN